MRCYSFRPGEVILYDRFLSTQINKPCTQIMSFRVDAISEGQSTEELTLTRKVKNIIILKRKFTGTR